MEIILKTNKLSKSYKSNGSEQYVLQDIDLEIYKSDFTVIMGASGSGKSTLLYALSGMDNPTSGDILYYDGQRIADMNQDELADFRRNNCGFVFQQIYLVDSMSVLDNVLLGASFNSKNKKCFVKKAKGLLSSVNISDEIANKFPSQLSGGEAQRVAVIRAIINKPNLLYADEPTGALNSQNAKTILDILTDLNHSGQSIIMVTHDILSAVRANRILFLKDGKISGVLLLSAYKNDENERKAKVKEFLSKLGW